MNHWVLCNSLKREATATSKQTVIPLLHQVARISRHRNVPHMVKSMSKEHVTIRNAKRVKDENKRKHSKPGSVPRIAERAKPVVEEKE